jgi:hypothetical protein
MASAKTEIVGSKCSWRLITQMSYISVTGLP